MKVLILGAGKMGTFLCDVLCLDKAHEVALFDTDPQRLRFVFNVVRMTDYEEIRAFRPDLLINCVTLKYTLDAFEKVLPYVGEQCIVSDIASVKTGLPEFYAQCGHRFASTHPMFGPTFARMDNLVEENAIIIEESCAEGKAFFRSLYGSLKLNIFEYTFREHDETMAYSLTTPFVSTLSFTSVVKHQDAPGTTFKRHLAIARGVLSEDEFLVSEILFNPHSIRQIESMQHTLDELLDMIKRKDGKAVHYFLKRMRKNIE